jgi:class 3 adenylate cyclase
VGETYPGVETHANMISGLLDGKLHVRPDYAIGYEVVVLVLAGLTLAFALPLLSATKAVAVSVGVLAAVVGLNWWLYLGAGWCCRWRPALVMVLTAFALNMSYGYFIESRSKRDLANLFGTYVPPELVDEMVKDPDSYSMEATNKELTVMFCDMRGFTKMSERMEPVQLQHLLNHVFNRLTDIIRANRGTIDKYMGDCVMAFWGAPVETPEHGHLAVKASLEMANAVRKLNEENRAQGLPEIGVGIGLNTGMMCVGDMGSQVRRSYTVIGDAVNLGSRLEGLSKAYGVDIVVSETTRKDRPPVRLAGAGPGARQGQGAGGRHLLAARPPRSAGSAADRRTEGLGRVPQVLPRAGLGPVRRAAAQLAADEPQKIPLRAVFRACSLDEVAAVRPRVGRRDQLRDQVRHSMRARPHPSHAAGAPASVPAPELP